jgi:hypothetical protein
MSIVAAGHHQRVLIEIGRQPNRADFGPTPGNPKALFAVPWRSNMAI